MKTAPAGPVLTTVGPPASSGGVTAASLAFSPTRPYVAVSNRGDNTVVMLAISSSGLLRRVGAPTPTDGTPLGVAFSPDGELLAVINNTSDSLTVYSVSPGGALERVARNAVGNAPTSVAFSTDGTLLAVASHNSRDVIVFRVKPSGELEIGGPPKPLDRAIGVAFGPGGLLAVSSSDTKHVWTFRVSATGVLGESPLGSSPAGGAAGSVAVSPDGKLLAATNKDTNKIAVFDIESDGSLEAAGSYPTGEDPYDIEFGRNGRLLATADRGGDGSVTMFSVAGDGTLTQTHKAAAVAGGKPESVAFSADGRLLATANGSGNSVSMYSVSARGLLVPIGSPSPTGRRPTSVAYAASKDFLVAANREAVPGSVSTFDVAANGVLTPGATPTTLTEKEPHAAAYHPSGTLLAVAAEEVNKLQMFSVAPDGAVNPIPVTTISTGTSPRALAFNPQGISPAGKYLAVPNAGVNKVRMYEVSPAGALTEVAVADTGSQPGAVAFNRDGRLLALNSGDVFHVGANGALTPAQPRQPLGPAPLGMAFNPMRDQLAVATREDQRVSVYDVGADGRLMKTDFKQAGIWPAGAAFSPDGNLLAVTSLFTNSMSLYRVESNGRLTELGSPSPTGATPFSPAFSPNGRFVATANTNDDTVSVFALRAPALDTAITSGPPPRTRDQTASFVLESNYPSTFQCSIDGGAYAPCSSPYTTPVLTEGRHIFAVQAKDPLDNLAEPPAVAHWEIDISGPSQPALATPAAAARNIHPRATFAWHPSADVDRYELWIGTAKIRDVERSDCGPTLCSATPAVDLAGGGFWFVRAFDDVGNPVDSAQRTFTVDATAPATFALTAPADGAATSARRPALAWSAASDGGGSGVSSYEVVLGTMTFTTAATSLVPPVDLAEGEHTWHVIARDANGNQRPSGSAKFVVDVTPPAARMTAAPNPSLEDRVVTLDGFGSHDTGSGIARYEWDVDGDGTFELDTGSDPVARHMFADPGTWPLGLRVTDRAGLSATARVDARITKVPVPGEAPGVTINNGDLFTNTPEVTLKINPPKLWTHALVSNDGGFAGAPVFGLGMPIRWTLQSSGPERLPKFVYVRFARGEAFSDPIGDDIILDERRPVLSAAQYLRDAKGLTIRLKASDTNSGVASVELSNNRRAGTSFTYKARLRITGAKAKRLRTDRKLYARVRDGAENYSSGWRLVTPARAR